MLRCKTVLRKAIWPLVVIFLVSSCAQTPDRKPDGQKIDGRETDKRKTENVILITLDGVRTQEIFGGLDLEILKSVSGDDPVEETETYKKYWAPTLEERRMKLMPFFWGILMKQHGSIAGNRKLDSEVKITNRHWFSYPGYSEILTGQAHDDVIDSNARRRNPYPSVLEFLKKELQLDARQVAVFATWERFNSIAEHEEGSVTINAGLEAYDHPDPAVRAVNRLQFEVPEVMHDSRFDVFTFRLGMAHLRTHRPRVIYFSFGETDEWSHQGRYHRTLEAIERTDSFLRELWDFLQSDEHYRGKTSILITTDHGRGITGEDWDAHGSKIAEAEYIWMAFVSPDVALRGEWQNAETIFQNQAAATLARFLGLDYLKQTPGAGKPVKRLFAK